MLEKRVEQSFKRVKQDVYIIENEITRLRIDLFDIKRAIKDIYKRINQTPTHYPQNQSHPARPTHPSTHNLSSQTPNNPNLNISIGNRGVPTDRQTNQQTGKLTKNFASNFASKSLNQPEYAKYRELTQKPITQTINEAAKALESLDTIKKTIRLKFKSITPQEMLVFSTIYQLEEQGIVDYKILANKLCLSQSSIRDYTQRLINKGIPISKIRINNKKITLKISPELKKIASLQTILKLRDI